MRFPCEWLKIAALTCGIFAQLLRADGIGGSAPKFVVRSWTTDDGLPANRIGCIKQTRDGYLWLGTWFGLVRFDGTRFVVFNKANTSEIADDTVIALAEDVSGTLWIGTKGGLLAYRNRQFKRFDTQQGLPDPVVSRILASPSGCLWLQAGSSVVRFQNEVFSHVKKIEFNSEDTSIWMHENHDGSLVIFKNFSWLSLDMRSEELRTNAIATGPSWLAVRPAETTDCFWIGTSEGLRKLDQGTLVAVIDAPRCGAIDFIWREPGGNSLWLNARNGGLFRRANQKWDEVLTGGKPFRTSVLCLEEDNEGSFWLGTDHGLIQLRCRPVQTFTANDGLPSDGVGSICEGEDGSIWAGTDHGLGLISNGKASSPLSSQNPEGSGVTTVWPRKGGGVWFAERNRGMRIYYDRQLFCQRKEIDGLFSAMYEDHSGKIWVSLPSGLAECREAASGDPARPIASISVSNVVCMLQDRNGAFWFGTAGKGLMRVRSAERTCFVERDGLSDDRVWSIHEDSEGALWFGTENGLTRYFNNRFSVLTQRNGLFENTINCILADDAGCLWLSGLKGVHRFKRAELNSIAEGRATRVRGMTVGTADGMESAETNGGHQPAGWKARDGRLWFPTIRGVVAIDPRVIPFEETVPVMVEEVKADGDVVWGEGRTPKGFPMTMTTGTTIGPGQSQIIEFSYTANTFVAPERTRFRYRLVGVDKDWRGETLERTAHYLNVKHGKYRFEVMAANHHNVWSAHPASFSFTLAPHFWQTWVFYLLCGCGALGLAAGFHGYRLRWQHRILKLEEQRNLANERARIARDLHDDLGASLTGIALQLEAAQKRGGAAPGDLAALAGEARSVAHDMRELAWTTNPRCDNSGSLAGFIGEFAERFCQAAGFSCRLDFPGLQNEQPVPARVRHELFIVLKESLANVGKHAAARNVTVGFSARDGILTLAVADDGRGFDAGQPAAGNGLRNLRERVQTAGGSFSVQTGPGAGTKITATVPLDKPKE